MYVLDRVLVNNSWDDKFNLAHVHTNPRLGPDHNPLIVDTGGAMVHQHYYFRFKMLAT